MNRKDIVIELPEGMKIKIRSPSIDKSGARYTLSVTWNDKINSFETEEELPDTLEKDEYGTHTL